MTVARNSLAEYSDLEIKKQKYEESIARGAYAIKRNGIKIPLMFKNLEDVEFCGGFWRVQHDLNSPVVTVNGKEFVVRESLGRAAPGPFMYYNALLVCENCYGKHAMNGKLAKYFIAKHGDSGEYGVSIEDIQLRLENNSKTK